MSWGTVGGASSYSLQEQVNGGAWTTIQNTAATSKAISGKTNGTYGYRVQACNAGGCGPWSSSKITTVLLLPPAPASISIPATSSGAVAVSWAASATATSYTLQHAQSGVTGWSTIYTGAATGFTRNETTTGTWIYKVQACNASGCSAFRASSGGVAVTIPPGSAPSLSVPATSTTGSYTVSWGGVTGASSYTLQEQVNSGSWSTIQTSAATSKAISGKGGGSYGYRVQACNVGGCGPWSATKTLAVTKPPAMPASVTAPSYIHGTSYIVSWSAAPTATSYNVQRVNIDRGGTTIVATTSATSATMAAPTGMTLLQYSVQACNASGCSAFQPSPNTTQTDPPGPIR